MKQHAPAAERNKEPILTVLRQLLPQRAHVLEIASGTGQHAEHFARGLPGIRWQPSDVSEAAIASIGARQRESGLPNLEPPLRLDVTQPEWPVDRADAVFCANMIHIAPWEACLGLLRGAGRLLQASGALVLYGPFRFDGHFTAPSNAAFDESLRSQDPAWGVRDLSEVEAAAASALLEREQTVAMPANNHIVVFRKVEAASTPDQS